MEAVATRIRVDSWPTVYHRCQDGEVKVLRFRGACRSGQEVSCADCGARIEYVKARPVTSPAAGQTERLSHF